MPDKKKYITVEPIEGEIWKEVEGTNGKYHVSDMGRVKRCYVVQGRTKHILVTHRIDSNGWHFVKLLNDKQGSWVYCSRLIKETFDKRPEGLNWRIIQLDCDQNNLRLSNLEWRQSKRAFSPCRPYVKKKINQTKLKQLAAEGISYIKIAKQLGCSHSFVSRIVNNRI